MIQGMIDHGAWMARGRDRQPRTNHPKNADTCDAPQVMSYGHTAAVSSITLAAMEDLGFYLGNYSTAQCMSWGQYQGCEYVLSRCASMINDQLASPLSESACNGNPKWASQPISLLTSKCQCGSDPCGSGCSGYSVAGGAAVCNAECFTGYTDPLRSNTADQHRSATHTRSGAASVQAAHRLLAGADVGGGGCERVGLHGNRAQRELGAVPVARRHRAGAALPPLPLSPPPPPAAPP